MPRKPCGQVGCHVLVELGQAYCARHAVEVRRLDHRVADQRRADRPSRRWYKLAAWRRRRARCLDRDPVCVMCPEHSRQVSVIADHVVPHRDNYHLFWHGELQGLCKHCHDSKKQRIERRSGG